MSVHLIELTVNDRVVTAPVEGRCSLADFLRDQLRLTGTHLGCEQGVCGSCTVMLDGRSVRSCLLPAALADGRHVRTVEGLKGQLCDQLREALSAEHGLQCGFCTPGVLVAATELLESSPGASEVEIRELVCGHVCRCTGYDGMVSAIVRTARQCSGLPVEPTEEKP